MRQSVETQFCLCMTMPRGPSSHPDPDSCRATATGAAYFTPAYLLRTLCVQTLTKTKPGSVVHACDASITRVEKGTDVRKSGGTWLQISKATLKWGTSE